MTTLAPPAAKLPTSPPPLRPGGGRSAIRVLLVVAAALLALLTVGILTAAAIGLGNTRVIADSQTLPATMRTLTIDTGRLPMAVRVTTDDDATEPRVDMRFVGTRAVDEQTVAVASEGADVRISVDGSSTDDFGWSRGGELNLVLPDDLARRLSLTTDQEFGVLFAEADLDRLVANTTNGAVVLRGSANSVEVNTRHGSVHTREPIAVRDSFVVTAMEGDIDVEFAQAAPETVEVSTGTGDVEIGLPLPGPYIVTSQAGVRFGSHVTVAVTKDPDEALATVVAASSSGSVTVDYADEH